MGSEMCIRDRLVHTAKSLTAKQHSSRLSGANSCNHNSRPEGHCDRCPAYASYGVIDWQSLTTFRGHQNKTCCEGLTMSAISSGEWDISAIVSSALTHNQPRYALPYVHRKPSAYITSACRARQACSAAAGFICCHRGAGAQPAHCGPRHHSQRGFPSHTVENDS